MSMRSQGDTGNGGDLSQQGSKKTGPVISSIDEWLQSIRLEVYASKIKNYGCDSLRVLDAVSKQDMEDMTHDLDIGMKKLHRIWFMQAWTQRAASKDFSDPCVLGGEEGRQGKEGGGDDFADLL